MSRRTARWLLVAVHVAVLVVTPTLTSFGTPLGPATGNPLIAYPLAVAILGLQHSVAFARGDRPQHGLWSFLALTALVYLPVRQFGWTWAGTQICVMASALMVLRGWPRIAGIVAPLVGTEVAALITYSGLPTGTLIYDLFYWTIALSFSFLGLYGSARLVRLLDELHATRAELAALAIGQERLRISRDLHDLLGHSLSAVSLKGDLAIRLLQLDTSAAKAEIQSLTQLAREAQRSIRAVSRDEHAVSLRTETEGAAALLAAAGIDTHIDVDLPELTPPVEHVLAWAVREGVANALRHSQAHVCTIDARRQNGDVRLEIVNDGAASRIGEGSGLAGLAERARALSGSSSWEVADGQFKLPVEVPERAA